MEFSIKDFFNKCDQIRSFIFGTVVKEVRSSLNDDMIQS